MIKSIKSLPLEVQKVYTEAHNRASINKDAVAWGVVKNRLKHAEGKYVALSESFKSVEYYTFDLTTPERQLVINATGDEITFEGILATTDTFQQDATTKRKFSEKALRDLADQINKNGSSHPDVDHKTMEALVKQFGGNYEMIMNAVPKAKGLIKSIQAFYENGKLWIKGVLSSAYRKMMSTVRGMSIEAISDDVDEKTETINKAKYLGFTFAVSKNPKMARAVVTSVA